MPGRHPAFYVALGVGLLVAGVLGWSFVTGVKGCLTSSPSGPLAVLDTVLPRDDWRSLFLFPEALVGDTVTIMAYSRSPLEGDTEVIGRVAFGADSCIHQHWEVHRRISSVSDTLWLWRKANGRAGPTSYLIKWVRNDPEVGVAVRTGRSSPSPRMGEPWFPFNVTREPLVPIIPRWVEPRQ
jgi:hypothetical protein